MRDQLEYLIQLSDRLSILTIESINKHTQASRCLSVPSVSKKRKVAAPRPPAAAAVLTAAVLAAAVLAADVVAGVLAAAVLAVAVVLAAVLAAVVLAAVVAAFLAGGVLQQQFVV